MRVRSSKVPATPAEEDQGSASGPRSSVRCSNWSSVIRAPSRHQTYVARKPPSTGSTMPVTYEDDLLIK